MIAFRVKGREIDISKLGPFSVAIAMVTWLGIVLAEHYILPPTWVWGKAWLQPVGKGTGGKDNVLVLTRADVISGTDVLVCKTGEWRRLTWKAEAVQNFIPLDAEWKPMNSAWKAAGVHQVRVPALAVRMDDCRASPIRLDTSLGVGNWGLRIETRTYSKFSPLWPTSNPVAIARFEVRE